jgi:hypothetical protein
VKRGPFFSGEDVVKLKRELRRRDVLDNAISLQRLLDAQALDERLVRGGYLRAAPERAWPRERTHAEATGQVLRRGPETWGDRVRAYVR